MIYSKPSVLAALALGMIAGPAGASPLSREQAEDAIASAIAGMGKQAAAKVYEVLGCTPAFRKPKGAWSCVIDHDVPGRGRRMVKAYLFRQKGERWSINPNADATGACAPKEVTQAAFRVGRNDPALRVLKELDEGEGTFTDARGMQRSGKGPMRLMCRYEAMSGGGEQLLFITYVAHDGQAYTIDPDWEIWD